MIAAYDWLFQVIMFRYKPLSSRKKQNELLSGQCFVTQLDEVFLSILSLNFNKQFHKIMGKLTNGNMYVKKRDNMSPQPGERQQRSTVYIARC